jgi:hypothetical protein
VTPGERTTVLGFPSPVAAAGEEKALYGLMAEFAEHDRLVDAAREAYTGGYRKMDAYTPFPVDGLAEALGYKRSPVPVFTFLGGAAGGLGGYFMEWYSMARLYPLNVGGRPLNSWPNFIPVVFEMTVLIASLTTLVSMLILNRLPEPHHPVFNLPGFERASIDRFFLCIETEDPQFELRGTRRFLENLKPIQVTEVWDG